MEGPDIPHQVWHKVLLFCCSFLPSYSAFKRSQSLLLQGCIVKNRFSADFPSKQSIYFGDNPLSVLSSNTSKIIPDFLPAQPNSAIIFTLVPYLETMTYETWISQIFSGSSSIFVPHHQIQTSVRICTFGSLPLVSYQKLVSQPYFGIKLQTCVSYIQIY